MTDEQKQRVNEQVKAIIIDMQAVQYRLDLLLGILDEDKTEAETKQDNPTLDAWGQTEPRPDDW